MSVRAIIPGREVGVESDLKNIDRFVAITLLEMAGVLRHFAPGVVEHPQLVAQRLLR